MKLPANITESVERRIYLIRGHKAMLDRDLARLYGVETRVLNQAVRRNRERFPDDFIFSLSREEILRISQIVTSSSTAGASLKFSKSVLAFTEHGVAMLSSVLNSPRAIQVNIQIMRAFAKLRELAATRKELAQKLDELERRIKGHDAKIESIFEAIRQLMEPPEEPRKRIGFQAPNPSSERS